MSLKHVILVVLKQGNSTGYEINQTFTGSLGIYWNTSHQAVYRALASLSKDAWVTFKETTQDGKPDKKVYRITDQGEKELNQWLVETQKPAPRNESLFVKFFAGDLCPTEALLKQVGDLKKTHQENIRKYQSSLYLYASAIDQGGIALRRRYLTNRRGIIMEQARLAWCEETLLMLNEDIARQRAGSS